MIGGVRIAILGFGLIGGSIARALRAPNAATALGGALELVAWSRRPDGPRAAVDAGILDTAAVDRSAAIEGAELVVLAAPPLACLALVHELAGPMCEALDRDATVTDVASTKATIVATADALGVRFVGGHPMAGREASGFDAASADLFVDRPWVICAGAHAVGVDIARVEALARACGARPSPMDSTIHDRATAAVSHVPLILAAALVEAMAGDPIWPEAEQLAAGGWRSMTRLARGDPAMGAGIAATNGAAIAAGLAEVRAAIDDWIAALDGEPDPAALEGRLRAARERLGS
jgi:prephenate dehydrogenase